MIILNHKLVPVGMRLVKTGISLFVCLFISKLVGWETPIYACIAAVFSMKGTVNESFTYGINRMLSTIVGGVLGLLMIICGIYSLNAYLEIIIISLGALLTIYFCVLIKTPDAAGLSCVVFLIIILQHAEDAYWFALIRVVETLIGIIIALIINEVVSLKFIKHLFCRKDKDSLNVNNTMEPELPCSTILRLYINPENNFLNSDNYEELTIDNTVPSNASYAIKVYDQSLEPRFIEEQLIFIQQQQELLKGDIGLFELNGDILIRKLGSGELRPLNSSFETIQINESFRIYGKVIG